MKIALSILVIAGIFLANVDGHGKLMKPINRSSLWRDPRFAHLNPPPNWSDNELFCGGVQVQYGQNGGRCGPCGDAWHLSTPRDNENGGKYGNSIIVESYTSGQIMDIEIDLNAAHLGHFEFRLCELSNANQPETNECFEQHLLQLSDGSGYKFPVNRGPGWYYPKVRLPTGVRCARCVVQWHYRAANGWGECDDGSQGLGCGDQETFRGCSDISIS